ncbi:MAG: hypothetical protein FWG71_04180 [Synergistaceae bacterium]|nr:hypothetical protein [Synergistaceae bacterium]
MIEELLYALDECFGGEGKDGGIFLEPDDPGLFSILDALSAEEASRPAAGMSIANHVYHLNFAIDVFIKRVDGCKKGENLPDIDWGASWQERSLNESEWAYMKKELARLKDEAVSKARDYDKHIRLVTGLLTHTVFHLGIIRVKYDCRTCR